MAPFAAYVICGTPRSGSTLLCEMLAASGAGRPNSYFREQDISYWAERWSLAAGDTDSAAFDGAYLAALKREAANGTGVVGLRLMWSSVPHAVRRLDRLFGDSASLVDRFSQVFGPTLFISLSRQDKIAQAVSLARAEQSGLWHLRADGSVLEGERPVAAPIYSAERLEQLVEELESDDLAWQGFFREHGIVPLALDYEAVTANPQAALALVLGALGRDPRGAALISTPTAKMADENSRDWTARLRQQLGR